MNDAIARLWPELRLLPKEPQEAEVLKKYEALVLRYPEMAEVMIEWAERKDMSEEDVYWLF